MVSKASELICQNKDVSEALVPTKISDQITKLVPSELNQAAALLPWGCYRFPLT